MTMTNWEISHLIATVINGWQHVEGIIYLDPVTNMYAYLANYPESAPHAIDLAAIHNIAIAPYDGNWQAAKIISSNSSNNNSISIEIMPESRSVDFSCPRAICLALLRSKGVNL